MHRIPTSVLLIALLAALPCLAHSDTDIAALAQHAVELQQSGNYAAAADAYRELLKVRPDDVVTHVNLGVVLVKLGRFDDAIAEYQAADKLSPGDSRISMNLALAYEKSGRLKEATEHFEALHLSAPQENRVTMLLADCELQLGNDDRVIELLQPIASQNSTDLAFSYMLGVALLHKHRIEESQVFLDRILRNGDTPEARFLLGTRMFESGDYPAAVKELASAAELNPHLPQLQSIYGQALLNTGDPEMASDAFHKELADNPNDYGANLGLAQILTARKQWNEAFPLVKRALQVRGDSPAARLTMAECLSGVGEFDEARPYAESAAHEMPRSVAAHETLSSVYAGLKLRDDAQRERQTARQLANAADPGPQLNEVAPDIELTEAISNKKVGLRDFRGKSPVVLVFGSYSCPNFRGSAEALTSMYRRYGSQIPFLLVYIREAHANDNWQSTRNTRENVELAPALTYSEKQGHAAMCSRKLHLPFPVIVDGLDGAAEKAYHAWPSRVFVIGEDGRVLYNARLTELDFKPQEMEDVLRRNTSLTRVSRLP